MHLYSYLHRKGKLIEHHTFTLFIYFFQNDLSAVTGAGFTVSNNKKELGVVVRNK